LAAPHSFPTRRSSDLIVDCIQEQPLHRPQSIDDVLHRMKKLQLLHGGELQNKSGNNAYYVGKRIAVLSAHKGAGATLVSLSLREDRKSTRLNSSHVKI